MGEAAEGARILGVGLHVLDEFTADAVRGLLLEIRPEVVITHPLNDIHPDHRHAAEVLLQALPEAVITTGHPRRVYACDSYNSLALDGPVRAGAIVDITDTFALKMRALGAHASQPIEGHFGPMAERLARLWGGRIGTEFAEVFTPLPVLGRLPAASRL